MRELNPELILLPNSAQTKTQERKTNSFLISKPCRWSPMGSRLRPLSFQSSPCGAESRPKTTPSSTPSRTWPSGYGVKLVLDRIQADNSCDSPRKSCLHSTSILLRSRSHCLTFSRSSRVSTPIVSNFVSTIRMEYPFSKIRSCSSFSSFSNFDTGRFL